MAGVRQRQTAAGRAGPGVTPVRTLRTERYTSLSIPYQPRMLRNEPFSMPVVHGPALPGPGRPSAVSDPPPGPRTAAEPRASSYHSVCFHGARTQTSSVTTQMINKASFLLSLIGVLWAQEPGRGLGL